MSEGLTLVIKVVLVLSGFFIVLVWMPNCIDSLQAKQRQTVAVSKTLCGDQEVIYLFDLKAKGDPNMHAVCRDADGKLSVK